MSRSPDRARPPLATWGDAVLLAVLAIGALAAGGRPREPAREVVVRSQGPVLRQPFAPGRLVVPGPLGSSILELDPAGGVRFVSSPCPGQDCVRMARVEGAGSALACLPNRVVVELVGGAGPTVDAVTR